MEGLKNIKDYVCNSCGAPLKLDSERQVLVCAYCGVTHDYAYYLNEDSLFVGYAFLNAKNYASASRTFAFILKKDPQNIMALKGFLLASLRITNIRSLENVGNSMSAVPEFVDKEVIRRAPDEYKRYFVNIRDFLKLCIERNDLKTMIRLLKKKDTTHNEYEFEYEEVNGPEYNPEPLSEVMASMYFNKLGDLSKYGLSVAILTLLTIACVIFFFDDCGYHDKYRDNAVFMSAIVIAIDLIYAVGVPLIRRFVKGFRISHYKRRTIKSVTLVKDDEIHDMLAAKESELESIDEKMILLRKRIIAFDATIEKRSRDR